LFVFVDESGDTGLPSVNSSKYFIINILVCGTDSINKIEKHFSRYRYFRNADKEFKRYRSNTDSQRILNELCAHISNIDGVFLFSFYIEKERYVGPYLNSESKEDYDATKFRNFLTKVSLEKIFEYVPVIRESDNSFRSIELTFDRYLQNDSDQKQLEKYFRHDYRLPTLQFINHIDSQSCSFLQMVDIVGTKILSIIDNIKNSNIENIIVFQMNDPKNLVQKSEKGSDTATGTEPFPSMGR
jgi:hypothetical protein